MRDINHDLHSAKMSDDFRPDQRELIREAISILCNTMEPRLLRKSDPGGEKPFDLVEVRLRALSKLQRRWLKGGRKVAAGASHTNRQEQSVEERTVFREALRDGYVLCQ